MKTAALAALSAAALMLSGCASLAGAGSDSPMPERTIKERTPSEVVTAPKKDRESALRLARMLVAQGRYEGRSAFMLSSTAGAAWMPRRFWNMQGSRRSLNRRELP